MKKIFLAIMAVVVALTVVACNEGTTVAWKTSDTYSSEDLSEIKWLKGSTAEVDQEWAESLDGANAITSRLGVEALAGTADCLVNGVPGTLDIDFSSCEGVVSASTYTATLEENADVTIVIGSAAKK